MPVPSTHQLVFKDVGSLAVNVKYFLHKRLNANRVDLEEDKRMLLIEVTYVGKLVEQFREQQTS